LNAPFEAIIDANHRAVAGDQSLYFIRGSGCFRVMTIAVEISNLTS